jgi:hypothetical protein
MFDLPSDKVGFDGKDSKSSESTSTAVNMEVKGD